MDPKQRAAGPGPFTVDMVRDGDRYELDDGHATYCGPAGGADGRTSGIGFSVLASDPMVTSAGVDVGFTTGPGHLRAPDIAIGNVPDKPGWVPGAPPLAVECASVGQDEGELAARIAHLLAAGTQFVWVVRLRVPRHVEVHEVGAPVRVVGSGGTLLAPGVLANPVPVDALWDGALAQDVTLRNLLAREGYGGLSEVREEGREEGGKAELRAALLEIVRARFGAEAAERATPTLASGSLTQLRGWLTSALTAADAERAFTDPSMGGS